MVSANGFVEFMIIMPNSETGNTFNVIKSVAQSTWHQYIVGLVLEL